MSAEKIGFRDKAHDRDERRVVHSGAEQLLVLIFSGSGSDGTENRIKMPESLNIFALNFVLENVFHVLKKESQWREFDLVWIKLYHKYLKKA